MDADADLLAELHPSLSGGLGRKLIKW